MKIFFFQDTKITKYEKYQRLLSGSDKLHHYGGLFRVLCNPKDFPHTTFAVAEDAFKNPISLVTITSNPPKGTSLICDSLFEFDNNPYIFPNHEMMAFTNPKFRNKGIAKKIISHLLRHKKVDKDDQIYVYSQRMRYMVSLAGYNAVNLHEFTV